MPVDHASNLADEVELRRNGLTRVETTVYLIACVITFFGLNVFHLAVKLAVYQALCAHGERVLLSSAPPRMDAKS